MKKTVEKIHRRTGVNCILQAYRRSDFLGVYPNFQLLKKLKGGENNG